MPFALEDLDSNCKNNLVSNRFKRALQSGNLYLSEHGWTGLHVDGLVAEATLELCRQLLIS